MLFVCFCFCFIWTSYAPYRHFVLLLILLPARMPMQSFYAGSLWVNQNCFGTVFCLILKCTAHDCYPDLQVLQSTMYSWFITLLFNVVLVIIFVINWYISVLCPIYYVFLTCQHCNCSLQQASGQQVAFEEQEKRYLRKVLVEERTRYCFLASCFRPVVVSLIRMF